MASLLSAPAAPESGRISQLLPSVKCSNCNAPVPIHELGDHVCAKPATALSGFQRLQNMVSPARSDSPKIPGTRRSRTFSFGGKKTPVPTSSRPPMPANALALAVQQQKLEEQASVRPPPRTDSRDSYASSYRASKSPAPSTQHLPPIPFPGHGSTLSANPSRTRTGSTASSNSSRPSVDVSRNRTPSNASRPSADYTRARNISNATASSNGRPSYDSNTRARTPSDNSQFRPPLQSSPSNHSVLSVHSNHSDPTRSSTSPTNIPPVPQFIPPPQSTPTPPPSAPSHHHQPSFHQAEPDTKTGGEAGMAGVGRRGFQAAARAAYFTVPHQDTRRNHAPGLLDINRAVNAANTPPLSPSLSSAHSPLSPFSQNSPLSAVNYDSALPSGSSGSFEDMTTPRMDPNIAPSRTPSPPLRSPFSDGSIPLPNVEPFDQLLTPTKVILADYDGDRPLSPLSESDYGGGLAYADSSDDEDSNELDEPSKDAITSKIEFPSYSSRSKTESVSVYSPRLHARSFSAATSISDYTPRNNAKSTGALDNAMETLFEDDSSPSTSVVPLPNTMNHPFLASAPESPRGDLAHKLPVRSHTSPSTRISRTDLEVKKTARSATSGSVHGRTRTCASCDETIEDGKWIPMDGGGVLCDRCWKNMYLPKCRRCNLPIEKQAVSSSDGQLKGKYHRDCFNCHSCHKPFPDKSFYVFDGKPFCEYHYHEANGSLCADPSCGKPIEGACAVSHAGDRFHPEHFVCQNPGCGIPLEGEYWEMDGRMLCEPHMQEAEEEAEEEAARYGGDVTDDLTGDLDGERDSFRNSLRAMRRMTRFIDIAGMR